MAKQSIPNPLILKISEYVVPTIIALAILSSLILVYYVMSTPTNNPSTLGATPSPTVVDADAFSMTTIKEGKGDGAKSGQTVTVHYTGTLKDGTKFDSSVDRKQPFSFKLGAGDVIQGWDIGVLGMKVGEKRKLVIPASMGYGAAGVSGAIPPNATLLFEVEMISFKD